MAIQGDNLSSYMIRPTEWSDTIIRARFIAPKEARVRLHASLFRLRDPQNSAESAFRGPSSELPSQSPITDSGSRPDTLHLSPVTFRGVA